MSVVSTRQNQIYDDNQNPILAMIPLLDMCNHEDGEVNNYEELLLEFIFKVKFLCLN